LGGGELFEASALTDLRAIVGKPASKRSRKVLSFPDEELFWGWQTQLFAPYDP
jgi:hypothetical protein